MTQVNGPINLVRMEGTLDKQRKVFYIFMDLHVPSTAQTECTDIRSTHIRNYLVNTFDNLKEQKNAIYRDFFLETFPDQSTLTGNRTDIYLNQMRNMFERIFSFNFKENKVVKPKEFPNVRLHYMDIRPYFTFAVGDPFGMINTIGDTVYSLLNRNVYPADISRIQNGMTILNSQLKVIDTAFFVSKSKKVEKAQVIRQFPGQWINYEDADATKTINYLANKIRNVYKNKNVKKIINDILDSELSGLFDKYIALHNKLYKFLTDAIPKLNYNMSDRVTYKNNYRYFGNTQGAISDDIMQETVKIFDDYAEVTRHIYILVMDLYFLRRALDKDYITNAISYTGAYHSANYIKFLANNFDFKITHAFYAEIQDLKSLNKKINSLDDTNLVSNLFYPMVFSQCIDVKSFPKDFE